MWKAKHVALYTHINLIFGFQLMNDLGIWTKVHNSLSPRYHSEPEMASNGTCYNLKICFKCFNPFINPIVAWKYSTLWYPRIPEVPTCITEPEIEPKVTCNSWTCVLTNPDAWNLLEILFQACARHGFSWFNIRCTIQHFGGSRILLDPTWAIIYILAKCALIEFWWLKTSIIRLVIFQKVAFSKIDCM